ncbi:hypothetical protein NMG60_11031091 [Bertholletia excelsa]
MFSISIPIEVLPDSGTERPMLCSLRPPPMPNLQQFENFRVFVATWNVGGKSPPNDLNLDDFLHLHDQSDIYVLGFQEIVPLNAGNVLVIEDNGPGAKWLSLISQSLNKDPRGVRQKAATGMVASLFFQRNSLKAANKAFRIVKKRRLKSCNCSYVLERKNSKDSCFKCPQGNISEDDLSSDDDEGPDSFVNSEVNVTASSRTDEVRFGLIASKQMVGIFVTIWARKELVQHIAHLRTSYVGRGIMGCLGNKGCIAVSMSLHQTSLCFVCSHLASGEREGDELRRNSDVIEILRNAQFPNICKAADSRMPVTILEHDRVIWFGDLNYRIAMDYTMARRLIEKNNWDALLRNDQLKMEKEAGKIFPGWQEGKIYFPPTYKYYYNSDTYAGETRESKSKRRTPAWCDRILWYGAGIMQLSYKRKEFSFSDHRPVYATFSVEVDASEGGSKKALSGYKTKI